MYRIMGRLSVFIANLGQRASQNGEYKNELSDSKRWRRKGSDIITFPFNRSQKNSI